MSLADTVPDVGAIAPWFGSSRIIAAHVGRALRGCAWVGVPFAGGMCELAQIEARTLLVSDLHRHVINLANVIATRGDELRQALDGVPFHQDALRWAQDTCRERETYVRNDPGVPDFDAAKAYFIASWMGRNGKAGTVEEFNGRLSVRWNANGGDSVVRYRNAVASLEAWQQIMRRCTFETLDCFAFLERCEDSEGHGIYCDPPWPDDGDKYKHRFTPEDHARLAAKLAGFQHTRIVLRLGVHPLVETLYPRGDWDWQELSGRTQANKSKREVLITRAAGKGRLFA